MSPRQYGSIAFVSTLAMLTLVAAVPAAAQTDEDAQLWTAVTVTGKLSDTLVYSADGQFRLLDGLSRYGHTVLRGSIGVKVRPDLTVSLGYAHSTANRTGKVWVSEERVFEQFTWKIIARPGFNLTTRGRLEQRWSGTGGDAGWRYRQFLRLAVPLGAHAPALVVSEESFINLNATDWGVRSGLDQQRGMIGLAIPLNEAASIEAGYQVQYVNAHPRDRLNHILPITLALSF